MAHRVRAALFVARRTAPAARTQATCVVIQASGHVKDHVRVLMVVVKTRAPVARVRAVIGTRDVAARRHEAPRRVIRAMRASQAHCMCQAAYHKRC